MNRIKQPLVSIVIPVFNGELYIKEAIESAINQTYKNIEIIVVNDGSTDNSESIINLFGNKIRYFKKDNGGVSSALNLGIKKMKGDYFSWLSHDDVLLHTKIEDQINSLSEEEDDLLVSYCSTKFINTRSQIINKKSFKRYRNGQIHTSNESLLNMYRYGVYNGCALLLPKSIFSVVGVFNEEIRFSQDLLLWTKMFLAGYKLKHLNKNLVLSRVHQKQVTQTSKHLIYIESKTIDSILFPSIMRISDKACNVLFYYIKRSALYGDKSSVKRCLSLAMEFKKILPNERIIIYITLKYSKIRPYIKKLYHAILSKGVHT